MEFDDLGNTAGHAATRDRLYAMLATVTSLVAAGHTSEAAIDKKVGEPQREGVWPVYTVKVISARIHQPRTGPARQIHFENEADRKRYGGE